MNDIMKTDIKIRQIAASDYDAIYKLIKTAFETADHSDGDEQDFADGLRLSEGYIPQLDLVAQLDGQLIGHIMLTKIHVLKPDGSRLDALMVAPLSVLKEYRSAGVGSALMKEGLRIASTLGYGAAFLLGEPAYYQRFGYKPTHLHGITHDTYPADYLMVREINDGALDGVTGVVVM